MSAAITVRGLEKSYAEHRAVGGIDLDVARGEVFALLGPNGAGKTTTVEILEGYRSRDAGEVSVLGADPADNALAWRRRIGIVLQSSDDFADLTVEETVRHFAHYFPAPRDVDEVIEATGLAEKRTARTRALSGGQRRRLDVALGIIGDPELLFLDEPTTGFDPEARRQFWTLIESLASAGTTILLTTHYLDEAEHLAERVAVIASGRIVEVATPTTLGGRDRAPARVTWLDPQNGPQRLDSHSPTKTVQELAGRFGGEVPGLTVTRPTLEDTYLQMIGQPA
ncbi:ABC-2 type transport system ATP-binding protein [Motilibacter peucedani]|uniref:ABC-2 type transport system ATP-binding protein n=1 Tax=Motilibacter peucedani TaxID=598650 RepID=A0A420XLQ2_9ACTN|nr:ABC transporter ATP-binding protein [Motilibacter peucedani]RKS71346.1 ABC-2 type transport system ATP-binding protein [Motilibacter peucedani]